MLLNIYKSIIFTEGGKYTSELAKQGYNFSTDNKETYDKKQELIEDIEEKEYDPEKI